MITWETIERRISCRAYADALLPRELAEELAAFVEELNRQSGLHFQFFASTQSGAPAIRMSPAMFSGTVYAFAALVGGDDPLSAEKVGYYGHQLVLRATELGLGTCWVASTYDSHSIQVDIAPGERLWDVIPMGFAMEKTPLKQRMIRSAIRRNSRAMEEFVRSGTPFSSLPDWFRRAIQAVSLAPSAINGQPIDFSWADGEVRAHIRKDNHGLQYNDLGIAKLQFLCGAQTCGVSGTWEWGDGGLFTPAPGV